MYKISQTFMSQSGNITTTTTAAATITTTTTTITNYLYTT